MPRNVINVPFAPNYPFSPGIRAGDLIFTSGQGGFLDDDGSEIKGIEAQTRKCLENIKRILETAGSSMDDVVKCTVFLGDVKNFGAMNAVYKEYFPKDYPARSTAITGLAVPNMLVEIECIAYSPQGTK